MNHFDFDRAFPDTPECIHSAIEMGIRKGEKKMKIQEKIISMVSAAAVLLLAIAVAALAGGAFNPTPAPDLLAQPRANDVRLYTPVPPTAAPMPTPPPMLTEEAGYWCTEKGNYYHTDENCSGMQGAIYATLSYVLQQEKDPCPICIGASCTTAPPTVAPTLTPTPLPADRGNTPLYITECGVYAHQDSACCGVSGARECTAEEARALGRISCPVCGSNPRETVYATPNGTYYHCVNNCSGMKSALSTTPTEAQWENKHACPVCLIPAVYNLEMKGEIPNQDFLQRYMPDTNNGIWLNDMVYTAVGEDKFHRQADCSAAPKEVEMLELALARNQRPCPYCISDLRKDNDLFVTAFGPSADQLWEGWRYSHCQIQDYKNGVQDWIFADNSGKTSIACTVYRDPRGVGADAERQLDVLFISADDSRRFLGNVTVEPLSSMYPIAMDMAEEHLKETGRYTGDEDHHVSDLTLLFDENRQIISCIMYFRQPDEPIAVSLEVTPDGIEAQIETWV